MYEGLLYKVNSMGISEELYHLLENFHFHEVDYKGLF